MGSTCKVEDSLSSFPPPLTLACDARDNCPAVALGSALVHEQRVGAKHVYRAARLRNSPFARQLLSTEVREQRALWRVLPQSNSALRVASSIATRWLLTVSSGRHFMCKQPSAQ